MSLARQLAWMVFLAAATMRPTTTSATDRFDDDLALAHRLLQAFDRLFPERA